MFLLSGCKCWVCFAQSFIVITSYSIHYTKLYDNVTNSLVQWRSENPYVAKVDAAGKVTAISAGTTTVTAFAADGKVQTSLNVKVSGAQLTDKAISIPGVVITSYSIHYTKLYEYLYQKSSGRR